MSRDNEDRLKACSLAVQFIVFPKTPLNILTSKERYVNWKGSRVYDKGIISIINLTS